MSASPPSTGNPADAGTLEQLGVNVIRGLAMDAPRAANSGHPGTAMALAPLAHVLFTRVMRHDPSEPRLARSRPLRPVQRARVDPPLLHAVPDRLRPDPRRPARLPALGQPHPGSPRAQPHARGRSDHRSPRPGRGQRGGHGHRRAVAPHPLLAGGLRPSHLRDRRRRLLRRGDLPRGRLAGRPPGAGTPGLRLRRQPHHHRRTHRAVLFGRRRGALRRLRVECGRRRRDRQRPRRPRGRPAAGHGRGGPSLAHHPAQPHRLPLPPPDRHGQGPRGPVLRGGDPTDQGDPRPPARRELLGARRRARHVPGLHPPRSRPSGPSGRRGSRRGAATRPDGRPGRPATGCPGGRPSCPPSPRRTGPWPPARPSRPASTPPESPSPASCPAAPTSPATPAWPWPTPPPSRPPSPAAASSTTASASTAWAG